MSFLLFAVSVDLTSLSDLELAKMLLTAVTAKNYWLAAGLGVWLSVMLLRKFGPRLPLVGPKLGQFLAFKWTGPGLALLLSLAGGLVNLVAAGQKPSWSWLVGVVGAAATAVFAHEFGQKAKEAAAAKAAAIQTPGDADKFLKGQ